ncbi:MAG: alpha-E domain-containing protein [Gammaproteobacteria bacterium]|nr:alpha-E domain-containing protein [Gammaproteobacteria bacterium]
MLSRTAESLFWTSRNMERADTIARKLEMGYRMSMMPTQSGGMASEWQSILAATGELEKFQQHYDEENQDNVEHFLVYSSENPSSIKQCIRAARNNARQVRTAITSDVWSALNQAYLEFQAFEVQGGTKPDLPSLCDWTKRQAATVRGAFSNTQLHQDGADFFNLGYFVERAGNTARMLDIKYHVLLPTIETVGGAVDNYQWTTLLRAFSSHRAFHWAYGGDYSPDKIAHFLILNQACPRSLKYCLGQTNQHLDRLSQGYGAYSPAQLHAMRMRDDLATASVGDIIQNGLHEFLIQFTIENNQLAEKIADSFLFGER